MRARGLGKMRLHRLRLERPWREHRGVAPFGGLFWRKVLEARPLLSSVSLYQKFSIIVSNTEYHSGFETI